MKQGPYFPAVRQRVPYLDLDTTSTNETSAYPMTSGMYRRSAPLFEIAT